MTLKDNSHTELSGQLPAEETGTRSRGNYLLRNTKIVRQVFITFLVAGLTYSITNYVANKDPNKQVWVVTLTVLIAGLALLIQSVAETEHRLVSLEKGLEDLEKGLMDLEKEQVRHSEEIRSSIDEAFAKMNAKMNKATELFRVADTPDPQTAAAMKLLRQASRIPPVPSLVSGIALSQISRTAQFLEELGQGKTVTYDGEDRDWILDLTMRSQKTIDATSLSTVDAGGGNSFDGGLWTSDLGQRYLELQQVAIAERGVQIRRVFILDSHGQTSDEVFQRIYRHQKGMGIHVKVLEQSEIRDEFKHFLCDFIVFDGLVGYESSPAPSLENAMKPTIVKTQLRLQSETVKDRIWRFERLWEVAQDLDC